MQPPHIPENFAEVLDLARRATCLSWQRDGRRLDLVIDDLAADRRTCVTLRLERLQLEERILRAFDRAKEQWTEYAGGPIALTLPDRRGAKALLAWLAEQAVAKTGSPNPASFSVFRAAEAC